MTTRALFLFLGLTLVNAGADAGTYQRTEDFATLPKNWRQTSLAQFYGYDAGRITGGAGAAGGLFLPGPRLNFYADVFLGGGLTSRQAITDRGRLALKRASAQPPYVTSAYVGHFGRPVGPYIDTVGIALTGTGGDFVAAAAIVQFSNGAAYRGKPVELPVGPGFVDWTCAWDPTGGKNGAGSLEARIGGLKSRLELPSTAAGYDFFVNAFGLFQPPFPTPNSNSFLWAYVGDLAYTAGAGEPPKLRVNAPRAFSTPAPVIAIRGTAGVAPGYRVRSVRYRVVHEGVRGRYYRTSGEGRWTARVRLPVGRSRIEFVAASDSGRVARAERTVRRRP